jgi:hypothetical protein
MFLSSLYLNIQSLFKINLISLNEDASSKLLVKTIQMGICSSDKFKLLRSMEIIAGLCQILKNESIISDFIYESVRKIKRLGT